MTINKLNSEEHYNAHRNIQWLNPNRSMNMLKMNIDKDEFKMENALTQTLFPLDLGVKPLAAVTL